MDTEMMLEAYQFGLEGGALPANFADYHQDVTDAATYMAQQAARDKRAGKVRDYEGRIALSLELADDDCN